MTEVASRDLDDAGRFGDWPADFDEVSLHARAEFLDFSQARQAEHELSKGVDGVSGD